jgi:hypothetical protein
LFVLAQDKTKQFRVHQFMLPAFHLLGNLEYEVKARLSGDPLEIIRTIAMAQRQFATKRAVVGEEGLSAGQWNELLYGKWLDPVMSLIGAYELLRQGQNKQNKNWLRTMIGNLRRYFPGIPDTEAIAKLIGEPSQMPFGPPLLLDGLLAYNEDEEGLFAPPPNKLDYSSPWTRWFDVID